MFVRWSCQFTSLLKHVHLSVCCRPLYYADNKQWCIQASGAAGSRMADLGLGGVLQVPDLMQALHGQSIAEFLSSIGMEYAPAQGEG